EDVCFTNDTGADDYFFFAIYKFAATVKPRFDAYVHGSFPLQYQVAAGSINELAASPNVLAAAAFCWQSPFPLEVFSSRGPTIDGRTKPDIAGPDGVSTATFGAASSCSDSN